jgi:CHAT domain-containing protein
MFLPWIVVGLSPLIAQQEAGLPKLSADAELRLHLPPGSPDVARQRFVVPRPAEGRFAVVARSLDCDVALGLEGAVLDADLGGGFDERRVIADGPDDSATWVVVSGAPLANGADVVVTLVRAGAGAEEDSCFDATAEVDGFARFLERKGAVAEAKLRRALVELAANCAIAQERPAADRAARLFELRCGKEDKAVSELLRLFGLAEATSDPRDRVALLKQAQAHADRCASPLLTASVGAQLGEALKAAGDADGAGRAFAAARPLVRGLEGPVAADVLLRCGRYLLEAAQPDQARSAYEQAVALRRPSRIQRLDLCDRLCDIDLLEGRHTEAVARLRAVESSVASFAPGTLPIEILIDLAQFNYRLGQFAAGEELVGKVLSKMPEGSGPVRGKALLMQSLFREEAGAFEVAAACLDRALVELGGAPGFDADRAACLLDRARLRRLMGRLDLAQQDLDAALKLAGDQRLEIHVYCARDGFASLAMARGDLRSAKRESAVAVDGFRAAGHWDFLIESLLTHAKVELALLEYDAARAAIDEADQLLTRSDVLGARASAKVRARYVEWGRVAQDLALARVDAADEAERSRETAWGLEQADHWRARALLASVAARDPAAGASPEQRVAELRKLLGPSRLLVEYADSSRRLVAYVVSEDALELVDLGATADLEPAVQNYRDQALRNPRADVAAMGADGHQLYDRLLGPILRAASPQPKSIVIVPNERLERFPFQALVVRPAATFRELGFVLDDWPVTYAPSVAVWVALNRRATAHATHRALFVADPDVTSVVADATLRAPAGRATELPLLPKTRDEVMRIAELLTPPDDAGGKEIRDHLLLCGSQHRRNQRLVEKPFELLLGAFASVDYFSDNDLRQFDRIHIATHTDDDPSDPAISGLVLSPGRDGRRLLDFAAIDRLRLDADLVVLSACTTAGGPNVKGEGVQSLARAFLERGARGVVATLSPVEDGEAMDLMKLFYEHLLDTPAPSVPDALAAAQRAIRKSDGTRGAGQIGTSKYRDLAAAHPYSWAQFVFIGDAR